MNEQGQAKSTTKKPKFRFNFWIVPGVIAGISTIVSVGFYLATVNMALVLVIIPSIAVTFFCGYKVTGNVSTVSGGISEAGSVIGQTNAFVIYGEVVNEKKMAKEICFEQLPKEKLLGDRWYFEDISEWKYVLFNDIGNDDKLTPFDLPDAAYTDPARLAIQLNMGRVNELFQTDPSLFEQLRPWVLVATITIVGFLIFLSGSPQ